MVKYKRPDESRERLAEPDHNPRLSKESQIMAKPKVPFPGHFWKHVQKTETCWLWTAGKNEKGYGRANIGQATFLAHRILVADPQRPDPR